MSSNYSMRQRYGLTGRRRSSATGRVYSIAGGAPNRPLVALAADANWYRVGSFMRPQSLIIGRGYSKVGDIATVKAWIDNDLQNWRAEPNRKNKPVLIVVEISQAPHIYRVLNDMFRDDDGVEATAYRLRTGDQNVIERLGEMQSGAFDVGGNWLCSWFDATLPSTEIAQSQHGRPFEEGKTVVSFGAFKSEEAPGLGREAIRSTLSAVESLRVKSQKDGELGLALNDNESMAAAIMVGTLVLDMRPPPTVAPNANQTSWGRTPWGVPVKSTLRGVF